MRDGSSAAADPDPGQIPQDAEGHSDDRLELERMLMEADRTMMQMVSLALSLIGFGFTITAFFNDFAATAGVAGAEQTVRRLGIALLALGLMFLSTGAWSQVKYRRGLLKRYAALCDPDLRRTTKDGRATPTFVTAFALLVIGGAALASVLLRSAF